MGPASYFYAFSPNSRWRSLLSGPSPAIIFTIFKSDYDDNNIYNNNNDDNDNDDTKKENVK